jgi:hypothetical protein
VGWRDANQTLHHAVTGNRRIPLLRHHGLEYGTSRPTSEHKAGDDDEEQVTESWVHERIFWRTLKRRAVKAAFRRAVSADLLPPTVWSSNEPIHARALQRLMSARTTQLFELWIAF